MKYIKPLLFTLALITCTLATAQVNFFEGTWEEAFAEAKTTGKYVFVDAYTDWCYWCKVMDKETFTDEAIAAYLNEEFIPIKVDMENGFGIKAAMKYRVNAFPTTLYFNSNGELIMKKPGYEPDNEKFLTFLKEVRADKRDKVFAFDSQNFDIEYPDFIGDMYGIDGKKKRVKPDERDAYIAKIDDWLKGQDDLYNEISWTVLSQCPISDNFQSHVFDNNKKYAEMYGASEFDNVVSKIAYGHVREAGKNKDEALYNKGIALINDYMADEETKQDYIKNFEMSYLQAIGNWEAYTMKADDVLKNKPLEDQLGYANSIAWTLYEKCEDEKCLKIMEEWMAKVVALEESYMYMDTYAALLYKNGEYPKAKKFAQEAIELGKKEETKVEDTEALLEKIEAAMNGE